EVVHEEHERLARRHRGRPIAVGGRGQGLSGATRDEARLMSVFARPALLVVEDRQAGHEVRKLARFQEIGRAGARMALEVVPRRVHYVEEAAGREQLGERRGGGGVGGGGEEDEGPRAGRGGGRGGVRGEGGPGGGWRGRVARGGSAARASASARGEMSTSVTSRPRGASQTAWRPAPPARSRARPERGSRSATSSRSCDGMPMSWRSAQ